MRVIIAGSRGIGARVHVDDAMRHAALAGIHASAVVSGGARGVDTLGEYWAKERLLPVLRYPADWRTHGRSAGHIRNQEMARNADALVAIWDGHSRGTADMIDTAEYHGLRVFVWRVHP